MTTDAQPPPPSERRPIVLYDGTCALCHRSVKWLTRRDRGRLWYAAYQGETAAALRARFPIPETLESVGLIDNDRLYLRSKVFLHAARYLTRPWRWVYHLRWLPAFLLDPFYLLVAKLRYRVFGRYDSCRLPTVEERARLLP